LSGRELGTLADVLGALDAQDFNGLVEVAFALLQRLLAVHHAGAGELAEALDVCRGVVRHRAFPFSVAGCAGGVCTGSGSGALTGGLGAGEQLLLPLGQRLGGGLGLVLALRSGTVAAGTRHQTGGRGDRKSTRL